MTVQKNELQAVIIRLNNTEYGLEIDKVKEIIRMEEITKLPDTAEYILGIINLRGTIIPIIDMKKKFFEESTNHGNKAETRIVVVEVENKSLGLLVDEVTEVMTVSADSVEKVEKAGIQTYNELFSGIIRIEERLMILLNVDRVLN